MAYTKDQRLINANPDKSAYELLGLGLSQEKYNELVAQNYQPTKAEKITPVVTEPIKPPAQVVIQEERNFEPIKPVVTRSAQPKLSHAPMPQRTNTTKRAILHNKKTGKKTPMTLTSAQFAAKLDKGNYNVIPL